jgi:hypothetical protein
MGAMCYFFCLRIELLNNEVNLLITHYACEVMAITKRDVSNDGKNSKMALMKKDQSASPDACLMTPLYLVHPMHLPPPCHYPEIRNPGHVYSLSMMFALP